MSAEDFIKLSVRTHIDLALSGISDRAQLAFYRSITYCGLGNTHGVVPSADLKQLGPRSVADELVEAGFWELLPSGWYLKAWDKWQAEFEALMEKRAKDAERQREKRAKDRQARYGESA